MSKPSVFVGCLLLGRLLLGRLFLGFVLCFPLSQAQAADTAVTVTARPLSELARYPERTAPASVVAMSAPKLSAEIAARVMEILPKPGDVVAPGSVLVRLDCLDYALAREAEVERLAALEARIGLAERKLERSEKLAASQLQAVDIVDERRALLVQLRAERAAQRAVLRRARYAEERCEVLAPSRSLVTQRLANPGDYAVAGTPLVALTDLSSIELKADVYAPDAAELSAGGVPLTFVTASGERLDVALRVVVGAINPAARSRELRAVFAPDLLVTGAVLPGMSGRLIWRDPRAHLPSEYLLERAGGPGVFVLQSGVARFVSLPHAEIGRDTVVAMPLDTQIIEAGRNALADGTRVQTRTAGDSTAVNAGPRQPSRPAGRGGDTSSSSR